MWWNREDRTQTEVKTLIPFKVSGQNLAGNSPFEKPRDELVHPLQSW